jgi:benzoate-CoA ligase
VRYGTTGWPVPGYEIELRGDDGKPGARRRARRPVHPGPQRRHDVLGQPQKTRDTFQGGWTKSGDKYVRNADGSYTYSGRSDDMLKVSGIYVSPFEVEATLVQHPRAGGRRDRRARRRGPDQDQGLRGAQGRRQATEAELKAFVKDKLAPYKYPRQIEFVADLPKTATGKIQRFKLREKEQPACSQ